LDNCKQFYKKILGIDNSNTILIAADKTPINFEGSINAYSNAPEGEVIMQDKYNKKFREMQ